jgi:hypothetical protein
MHSLCSDCEDDTDGFGKDVFLARYLGPITAHYLHHWRSSLAAFWYNFSFADIPEYDEEADESSTFITDDSAKPKNGLQHSRVRDTLNWLSSKYKGSAGNTTAPAQVQNTNAIEFRNSLSGSLRPTTIVHVELEGFLLLPKENPSVRWLKEASHYIGNALHGVNNDGDYTAPKVEL